MFGFLVPLLQDFSNCDHTLYIVKQTRPTKKVMCDLGHNGESEMDKFTHKHLKPI